MRLADLPVRTVTRGVLFAAKPSGGREIFRATPEIMADVRALAAFKRLETPKQIKDRFGVYVSTSLEDLRNPKRCPFLTAAQRREILALYDAWREANAITPGDGEVCRKHNIGQDTLRRLVAEEMRK